MMPFGRKPAAGSVMIDFDAVHRELIVPAIRETGLMPDMTGILDQPDR